MPTHTHADLGTHKADPDCPLSGSNFLATRHHENLPAWTHRNLLFPQCSSLLLEFTVKVVLDLMEKVSAVFGATDAVGFGGIDHEPELFACLDQGFDHLDAVLEMHVVVAGSVGQEERALQLIGYFERVKIDVACRVRLACRYSVRCRRNRSCASR
jgi:hypothetical protein